MKILTGWFILSLTLWFSPAYSQTDQRTISAQEMFQLALQKFKTKDYAESRKLFLDLLAGNSSDVNLLYNVGLVEFADNHQERALAYWRRALFLSPGHAPSLEGISRLKVGVGSYSWPLWLYWRTPIALFFILAFVFWVACGALILRNIRRARRAHLVNWKSTISVALLFIVSLGFSSHYYYIQFHIVSGTLVATTPASASPATDAPSLFEFKEGDEVTVLRNQNEWLQVKKSATAVGWVKTTDLIIHSGT